jgi:predicted acetyltransferase
LPNDLAEFDGAIAWQESRHFGKKKKRNACAAPGPVLSLDVTALGCLYTGYMSAQQMALVGSVTGEATAIEAATLLFASIPGGLPWATQIF